MMITEGGGLGLIILVMSGDATDVTTVAAVAISAATTTGSRRGARR